MGHQEEVTGLLPVRKQGEELIQRILNSQSFQRSPRQRELLEFIAAEYFAGRSAGISEQHIGHEVFGRPAGYNQAEDNIVRVAARQLRIRLHQYFEGEGREEEWLVEIPKGGYRIEFRSRGRTPGPRVARRTGRMGTWLRGAARARAHAVSAVGVGMVCLCLGYVLGGSHAPRLEAREAGLAEGRGTAIEALLADTGPVKVVVADTALIMLQAMGRGIPTVEDYARHHAYLEPASEGGGADTPELGTIPGLLGAMRLTSLADVSFVARMLQSDDSLRKRIQVRHARSLNSSDLSVDDAVILGGPRVNPWAGIFEPGLNFQFQYRDVGPGCFVNQKPESGERARYGECGLRDAGDYARIAWVPNLSRTGHVLLISGNSVPATESASDFLLEPGSAGRLLEVLGAKRYARMGSFELLLYAPHRAGAPVGSRLLARRVHGAEGL